MGEGTKNGGILEVRKDSETLETGRGRQTDNER